jgi:hypothetical protein
MKEKKNGINLVARFIGGLTFLAVFSLNVGLFVNTESEGLSLEVLKAYAQTGGTNNEEVIKYFNRIDHGSVHNDDCDNGNGYMQVTTTGISCYGVGGTISCTMVPITTTWGPCISN